MLRFLVLKRGVYLQDVHGPFSNKEAACARAQQLAEEDYDDYHEHQVSTVSVKDGLLETIATYRKYLPNGGRFSESGRMHGQALHENKHFKMPF